MSSLKDEVLTAELSRKLESLKKILSGLGSVVVAFSGGVDSYFLLYAARYVLKDNASAVTAADFFMPERELNETKKICAENNIRHFICRLDMLRDEKYSANGPDRCYYCKKRIFSEFKKIAAENNIKFVAEGSNIDDLSDYRPGFKAIKELSVKSPLIEAGLSKSDIRKISKVWNLPVWDKPSYACLASRIAYGEKITENKLRMIEKAEEVLVDLGFSQERVRMHGCLARIEVLPCDIIKIASDDIRNIVCEKFKEIGFEYTSLDLKGYRPGSMNETLDNDLTKRKNPT